MIPDLRKALTETFVFGIKAQIFHWNVVGPGFPSYHSLFGDIYADAQSAVDALAERLRTLDALAPTSPMALTEGTRIRFSTEILSAPAMVHQLLKDNDIVILSLRAAFISADPFSPGLSDFLQSRLDIHAKWGWMLKATGV